MIAIFSVSKISQIADSFFGVSFRSIEMRYIAMDLVHGFRTKRHNKEKGLLDGIGSYEDTHMVIIRIPHSWVLKLMFRVVILALVIVCLSWIGTSNFREPNIDSNKLEMLPLLFHDLANEGLLKMGYRALFISNGNEEVIYKSKFFIDNEIDLISHSHSERQSLIPNETFDFAFACDFQENTEFLDRVLKVGGIAAIHLSENPTVSFQKPSNYKIVYLRRFDSQIVAMRKTSCADGNSPTQRRLCGLLSNTKRAALEKLEDVLLEPPRAASGKSKTYLKRTRYLPDLIGDSLESYPRRVFIDVGLLEKNPAPSDAGWFAKHYPTRNKEFEIYNIEMVTEESSGKEVPEIGMTEWLRKNVKEDEYVVMKSEAEVVEEMVKSKAIRLVDELFLECKHKGIKRNVGKRSRRAYWECLALYGRLRDEGVAVHQWWG